MSTNDQKRADKYEVISQLARERFPLWGIDKLKELQQKYPNDPRLQMECSVWIATVYEENGHRREALAIYEEAIRQPDLLGGLLPSLLPTVLKMWTGAGRLEEAVALFKQLIHHNNVHFMSRLSVLAWYARDGRASSAEIESFRPMLSGISEELGVSLTSDDSRSNILNLEKLNLASNHKHMQYQLSLNGKSKDERIALTREYLDSNPIPFYRKLAERTQQQIVDNRETEYGST